MTAFHQKSGTKPIWREDGRWKREVLACQAVCLAFLLACALFNDKLDAAISALWALMYLNPVVRWDSFEPLVVSISFAIYLGFWRFLDQYVPAHKLQRYKLHDTTYEDLKGWYTKPGDLTKTTVLWYLVPLLTLDAIYPRRTLPSEAPSFNRLVGETVAMLFAYDLFFTVGHMALHRVCFLYTHFHAKHHMYLATHAVETFRLDFVELWYNVSCAIAAVNVTCSHPLSRALFNIVISYLLTELHSGYNMPWMLSNIVPFHAVCGSREHCEHHRTGKVHFQKFFSYIDRALGHTIDYDAPLRTQAKRK